MPYKQNCKVEGEVITKFKIAKLYFAHNKKQRDIAHRLNCHYNTVGGIIKKCKQFWSQEVSEYLLGQTKLSESQLEVFNFLKSSSRRPKTNRRCLQGENEQTILSLHENASYGPKRMFKHLKRQGYDTNALYTLAKIKGVYKRNGLRAKKTRTANGNRRPLYAYDKIAAFEQLQYDTKVIADQKALPKEIYAKFKHFHELPKYQWTIVDAKTKVRFLAWSYSLSSFFGFKFLEFVICWLRAHNVQTKIHIQVDGGTEFCSGSQRKLKGWNDGLFHYGVEVFDTAGVKWKQNLIERTHKTDDEEFYCPRGEFINNKSDFLVEGQNWIIYHNNRLNDGIGLNGITPKEKLSQLGYYNGNDICNFPCLILEDYFLSFKSIFNAQKSQNVLTHYPVSRRDASFFFKK